LYVFIFAGFFFLYLLLIKKGQLDIFTTFLIDCLKYLWLSPISPLSQDIVAPKMLFIHRQIADIYSRHVSFFKNHYL
jgi:hypothetical protein